MKKDNKELIFERMGISSPKFTVQKPVEEDAPQAGNLVHDLQNVYYKYGVFPMEQMNGEIEFISIDENQDHFDNKMEILERAWNQSNLPY